MNWQKTYPQNSHLHLAAQTDTATIFYQFKLIQVSADPVLSSFSNLSCAPLFLPCASSKSYLTAKGDG